MAAKCDVCGKMAKKYFTTCHAVCVFEFYSVRLEERREKDEPLNKQVYNDAREMAGVVSLYKHGSKEVSREAAKLINKYYGLDRS